MSLLRGLCHSLPLPPPPLPLCWHTARRACEFNSCGLALVPLESLSVCPTVRVCLCVCEEGSQPVSVAMCWRGADVVGSVHTHRLLPATRNKREGAKQQKAFGIFIVSPFARGDEQTNWWTARETDANCSALNMNYGSLPAPTCPASALPDASSINQRTRAKRTHTPCGPATVRTHLSSSSSMCAL